MSLKADSSSRVQDAAALLAFAGVSAAGSR